MNMEGLKSFSEASLGRFHKRILLGGIFGQYTNGYVLGAIAVPLVAGADQLGLTNLWTGLIAVGSLVGIITGNIIFGPLTDRFGRKRLYGATPFLLVFLSALQFFSATAFHLFAMRFFLGIAIGADYVAGLTLMSEWSPTRQRGRILSFVLVSWVMGYVSAYLVGCALDAICSNLWRLMLASSSLPALMTLLARWKTPESPHWLAQQNRLAEARAIINAWLGKEYTVHPPSEPTSMGEGAHIFNVQWSRNLCVGSVFFACQSIPYYGISLFLPLILANLGMGNSSLSGIFFYMFLLVGVFCGTWVINKISRRTFLAASFYLCAVCLFLTILLYRQAPVLSLCTLSVFSLTLSAALVLQFVYPSELFPIQLRASGMGLVMGFGQSGSVVGTMVLPVIIKSSHVDVALGFCAVVLLVGGLVCHSLAPDPYCC